MKLSFTDPISKEVLLLNEIKVGIDDHFGHALGKDPDERKYFCDENAAKLFPLKFSVNLMGWMDSGKHGCLLVEIRTRLSVEASAGTKSNFELTNKQGYTVILTRGVTGKYLEGHVAQEDVAKIIRKDAHKLDAPIKAALLYEIYNMKKHEALCSSAHASRARIAGLAHDQIKKGVK